MNCETCLTANSIPNCYTGTVLITIGYLDAAYFSTNVIVKITNTATGKEILETVATDGAGVVTFTAFNFMEHYKVEVLDEDTYQPLTIYTNETTDAVTSYSCCVEFDTLNLTKTTDFTLNFEGCTGTSASPVGGTCCVSVSEEGVIVLSNASDLNFVGSGVTATDDGDGTSTITIAAGGSTNLSLGTVTATTIDVDSDTGTNATLPEANTTDAGVLGAAKWNEIVANTAKVGITVGQAADIVTNTAKTDTYITRHPLQVGTFNWPAAQVYFVGWKDSYIGIGAENNTPMRVPVNSTLIGAVLSSYANGAAATATNAITVELYKNSTTLSAIDSTGWIPASNINFVVTGLSTAILSTDKWSIKCTAPVAWGGTMNNQHHIIHLRWKIT